MFCLTEPKTLAHLVIKSMLVHDIVKVYKVEKITQRWKSAFADVVAFRRSA